MKIYFAGSYTPRELDLISRHKGAIMQNWSTVDPNDPIWKKLRNHEIENVIFDSGGYQLQSGTNTRRKISVENYSLWLELTLRNYPNIRYLNLDIWGEPEKTINNLFYLESNGLKPIPVWQAFKSDVNDMYLEYYCNHYEYIAIGGIANVNRSKLRNIVTYIYQQYPNVKVHLLGTGTALSDVCRFYIPYSADASTWLSAPRWGTEIVLEGRNLKLRDMSSEDKIKIRANDAERLIWTEKAILAFKKFELEVNNGKILADNPHQIHMFINEKGEENEM